MNSVIRTIRISKEYNSIIEEEAKERGVSVNSFFNQLLEKHIDSFRFIDSLPCLVIPCEIVKEFLKGISEDTATKAGRDLGSYIPLHSLFLKRQAPTIDNVLALMKTKGQNCNWYQFSDQNSDDQFRLLLRHEFGMNWSIYLNEYYRTLFSQLKIPIKTEIGKNSLVLVLPTEKKQAIKK